MNRSAPRSLASSARARSLDRGGSGAGHGSGARACPAAASRPSSRVAMSYARSASVHRSSPSGTTRAGIGPAVTGIDDDGLADQRRAGVPEPLLPRADSCACPPTTLRPRRRSAPSCAGRTRRPAARPTSRWNWATAAGGTHAVDAVSAPDVVPHLQQSLLQGADIVADQRQPASLVQRCDRRASTGRRRAPARSRRRPCRRR